MRHALALLSFLFALPIASAAQLDVHAGNGMFAPDTLDVHVGDTVVFTNTDDRAHTVTSAWDDGATANVVLRPGQSIPIHFSQSGTFTFRCVPHSTMAAGGAQGMTTTIRVAGSASAPTPSGIPRAAGFATFAAALVAFIVWNARGMRRRSPPPAPTPTAARRATSRSSRSASGLARRRSGVGPTATRSGS